MSEAIVRAEEVLSVVPRPEPGDILRLALVEALEFERDVVKLAKREVVRGLSMPEDAVAIEFKLLRIGHEAAAATERLSVRVAEQAFQREKVDKLGELLDRIKSERAGRVLPAP